LTRTRPSPGGRVRYDRGVWRSRLDASGRLRMVWVRPAAARPARGPGRRRLPPLRHVDARDRRRRRGDPAADGARPRDRPGPPHRTRSGLAAWGLLRCGPRFGVAILPRCSSPSPLRSGLGASSRSSYFLWVAQLTAVPAPLWSGDVRRPVPHALRFGRGGGARRGRADDARGAGPSSSRPGRLSPRYPASRWRRVVYASTRVGAGGRIAWLLRNRPRRPWRFARADPRAVVGGTCPSACRSRWTGSRPRASQTGA
jgi:hypothetical protein